MPNKNEMGPERIPTREEVMDIISRTIEGAENAEVLREISDADGLSLLDLRVLGEGEGETIEVLYTRKGILPNGVPTTITSIDVSYYLNGRIHDGDTIARLNDATGEWE